MQLMPEQVGVLACVIHSAGGEHQRRWRYLKRSCRVHGRVDLVLAVITPERRRREVGQKVPPYRETRTT